MADVINIPDPVREVHERTNLAKQWQGALGLSLAPMPLLKKPHVDGSWQDEEVSSQPVAVSEALAGDRTDEAAKSRYKNAVSKLPASFFSVKTTLAAAGGRAFEMPVDPLISVSGKNIIIRRYVAKSRMHGSVKERWSRDDCEITIAGSFQDDDSGAAEDHVRSLLEICEHAGSIEITCEPLNRQFGITRIVIESYDFPFTRGEENQQFTIKAYSDDNYILLEEKDA
jgi:hypothetical protein